MRVPHPARLRIQGPALPQERQPRGRYTQTGNESVSRPIVTLMSRVCNDNVTRSAAHPVEPGSAETRPETGPVQVRIREQVIIFTARRRWSGLQGPVDEGGGGGRHGGTRRPPWREPGATPPFRPGTRSRCRCIHVFGHFSKQCVETPRGPLSTSLSGLRRHVYRRRMRGVCVASTNGV